MKLNRRSSFPLKNKFRISSFCASIFGTVIGGAGAGAAEPESAPEPESEV
jgi:hypothetical protein